MASIPNQSWDSQSLQNNPEIRSALEVEAVNVPTSSTRKREGSGRVVEKDGVFLTWEDLWVTVNGKHGSRSILQGLTGYARPGELLAIMGPSGCGKSTLLDTLAGRLDPKARQTGDILINGRKQSSVAYGTLAYVTQDDALITTLTVREAIGYSAQLQLPDTMSVAEKKERAEMTIKEMGLEDAMDTRIGGWGAKGLSGGQKRRVSICIEMLTHPRLLFLDEPTSGLDSAASYYVMSRIASLNRRDGIGRTIVASIHQPSSEVFQLFTNLYLLSSGRTVYFGPASATSEFFALNGFPCPAVQNPSDHFLKTINKDFEQDIEQGYPNALPTEEVIKILVNSYKSSETFKQVQKDIAQIHEQVSGTLEKRKRAGFFTQCQVLTRRSFTNMFRDLGYYWLRLVVYIALALGLATLFSHLGHSYNSIQARGSLIMFIASFLTFMAIGGFPSFVEDMKVFERERLNRHYSVTAFVIGNTFSALPFLIIIALVPGVITYYLPGLHKGADRLFYFVAVLFACMMLVESLMMTVASIVPNFLMGIITGAGIQGLMILGGGFFRLPDDMPDAFWKYPLYYLSFHRYAIQGMFKNEFEGLRIHNMPGRRPTFINGQVIVRDNWQAEMAYSKWVDLAVLLGMVVFYRALFLIIIKLTEKLKPTIMGWLKRNPKKTIQVIANPYRTPLY
ncbi:hypothetical protein SLE2022_154940 [Rubroshorea leprosula]